MTESLDAFISKEEEERAEKYWKKFWGYKARQKRRNEMRKWIKELLEARVGSEYEGILWEYRGTRDFRTGRLVEHGGVNEDDLNWCAAIRVEGRQIGYKINGWMYDVSQKKLYTEHAEKIMTKEGFFEYLSSPNSEGNFSNYISESTLEGIAKLKPFFKKR